MKPVAKEKKSKQAAQLWLKDEQIVLLRSPVVERRQKVTVLPVDMGSPAQKERARLENKYRDLFEERPDCRRLVTYVLNKQIPLYNWFKYKEGFSRELVVQLFREFALQAGDIIFDPFLGCGTTLLAGNEFGIHGVGIDMLPTSVFVAQAKLTEWPDIDLLLRATQKLTSTPFREPTSSFPDVRIINLAFTKETQRELLFFKEEIESFEQPVRHFLMLGLLSILESVSSTSKDGQFLRLVEKIIPPVRDALRSVLAQMIADLSEIRMFGFPAQTKAKTLVMQGDAREMCLPKKYIGNVAAVITSPPYLNRYDYSRTYALELCLLTVKSHKDMVNVRHSLLRSHVESREHEGKVINLPVLEEVLRGVRSKPLNNERLPIMIEGYFEDMNLVIRNMAAYLKPGGRVALVVANAQFNGESVPTDLMLCELAERFGLTTESIWVTRYKGNSSQQMAIYGRRPVRETILFWRKHG
jgi:site-specific DNA-methyltransferase (cytosine-N4-specific)